MRLSTVFGAAGYTTSVMGRSFVFMLTKPRWNVTARLMYDNGLKSFPVVAFVAFFSGMTISLQSGINLALL